MQYSRGIRTASRRLPSRAVLAVYVCAVTAACLTIVVRAGALDPSGTARLVGRRAPDFSLAALQNGTLLSTSLSLDGLRGQTVLLVFVNSLCVHCGGTAQAAIDLTAGGAHARVLLVDSPAETTTIAEGYALRLGIEAPILLDSGGRVSSTYGIAGYPATFLVDGAGIVRDAWTGEVGSVAMAKALGALSVK